MTRDVLAAIVPRMAPGARIDGDEVVVDLGGRHARAPLGAVLAACETAEYGQREQVVEVWFRTLLDHLVASSPAATFSLDDLRTRLVPSSAQAPAQAVALSRPFGGAFRLELVIDQPGRRRYCGEPSAAALGLRASAALERGLRNTIRFVLARHPPRPHTMRSGAAVSSVSADDQPFVSTGLGSITELFGAGSHGELVAAPTTSALLCYRVEDANVFDVAPEFAELVADMHREAADPCSADVFWNHEHRLHEVRLLADGSISVDRRLEHVVQALER